MSIRKALLILSLALIIIPAIARDFYWIDGTGNWSDPEHWSDRPGGQSIGETPGFEDNVFFDEYSFTAPNQMVIINTIAVCRDMDWSKASNNPRLLNDSNVDTDLTIYGSLKLTANMIFNFNSTIYFRAASVGNTINMKGQSFKGNIYFQNNGGWSIVEDMDLPGKNIYFEQGTLEFNGEIKCLQFISETGLSRSLNLNNSNIILQGSNLPAWKLNTENLIVNAGNSTITVLGNNARFETTGRDTLNYHSVNFQGANSTLHSDGASTIFYEVIFQEDGNIEGNNAYTNLIFNSGKNYSLTGNCRQTISGTLRAKGDCYNYITIKGRDGIAEIDAVSVDLNNVKTQNLNALGSAVPFKALESFNLGNCIGWDISDPLPKNFTWIGNGDDTKWSNPENWDVHCVPTRIDNVTIGNFSVNIDMEVECFNITLSSGTQITGGSPVNIFGSLLAEGEGWDITGETRFMGNNPGNFTIHMGANTFKGDVFFKGTGKWELQGALNAPKHSVFLLAGELYTKNHNLLLNQFHTTGETIRSLHLGRSEIIVTGKGERAWEVSGNNLIVNAIETHIRLVNSEAGFYSSLPVTVQYNSVSFEALIGRGFLSNYGSGVEFTELSFWANASIKGSHTIAVLGLKPGNECLLEPGSIQTITGTLDAWGTCAKLITLKGDGGKAVISSDVDIVINSVRLENIMADGLGHHKAEGAIDLGGTEGTWNIVPLEGRDLHWNGKGEDANWFNPENWKENCIPNRMDNVFFSQTDFFSTNPEVKIKGGGPVAECRSMNWNNAPASAKFTGSGELELHGSLDLSGLNTMEYTGKITCKGIMDQQIKSGGVKLLGNIHFEGNKKEDGTTWESGSYTLVDMLETSGNIILERGELNTNNQEVRANEFHTSFHSRRGLNLGSSGVYLHTLVAAPDNLILDAEESILYFDANGLLFNASGTDTIQYGKIIFENSDGFAQISTHADNIFIKEMEFNCNANLQYGSLTIGKIALAPGKTYRFQEGEVFSLGSLIASGGCEGLINMTTFTSGEFTTLNSKNGEHISAEGINMMDIHAQGAVFTAYNSIDLGSNDGWNITTNGNGRDLYWVGGTGNWNEKSHWSATSGGTGGACIPTALDDVYFDSNSFTAQGQIVYAGSSDIRCKTMNWTGAVGSPGFVSTDGLISGIHIYGSLILIDEMEIDLPDDMNISFLSTEKGQIIQTGEHTLPNDVTFDGLGGEWTLQNHFRTEGNILLNNGSFISNTWDVECLVFLSENTATHSPRILDIQKSTLTLNTYNDNAFKIVAFNTISFDQTFNLKADNSTIQVKNPGKITFTGLSYSVFNLGRVVFENNGIVTADRLKLEFNHLVFYGDGEIYGTNFFDTLEFTRGNTYKLENQKEYVIGSKWIATGTCNFPITIQSAVSGSEAIVSKASGDITLDYVEIEDIYAKNTGAVYRAINSVDNGNTNGWDINSPVAKTLYWVGNGVTNQWDDYENWSTTSGGVEGGCVPTITDNVVFDDNSFYSSKKVTITSGAYCHNMTWKPEIDPAVSFTINHDLTISGSLTLSDKISVNCTANLIFSGNGNTDIKFVYFAGKSFNGDIIFQGKDQSWKLESDLITSGTLSLRKGFLDTQDNNLEIYSFESINFDSGDMRELELGNSHVKISSSLPNAWKMIYMNADGDTTLKFHTDFSQILFLHGGGLHCEHLNGTVKFNDIVYYDNGIINMKNAKGEFNLVSFKEKADIRGDNSFNSLEFTIGHHNTIQSGKTITINRQLIMEGVSCEAVELKSDSPGNPAFIWKSSGEVNIYHARLQDIHVIGGGAYFWVNGHFENVGNNIGWLERNGNSESPSWGFGNPVKEEYCSSKAVIDEVKNFPVNQHTTYQWHKWNGAAYVSMPGATKPEIEIMETGKYKVKVIYSETCSPGAEIEVIIDAAPKMTLATRAQNLRCFNDNSGQIEVKVSDGYKPYSYKWVDAAGSTVGNEDVLYDMPPGKYFVQITDNRACEGIAEAEIFNAYPLDLLKIDKTDITCYGENKGQISITAKGGTGNLHYYLNNVEETGSTMTNLFADTYKVFVQDDNKCSTPEKTLTITQPAEIITDWLSGGLNCHGDQDGSLDPQIKGGISPYIYNWSGPGNFSSADTIISGLPGGYYMLNLIDQNSCIKRDTFHLIEPDSLLVEAIMAKEADCYGNHTGEIVVHAKQGVSPYTFKIKENFNNTGIFRELPAGTHQIEVTDNNGCKNYTQTKITEPDKLKFLIDEQIHPSCTGEKDGKIQITPLAGKGAYTYTWTGPNDYRSNTEDITELEAGTYRLKLKDKNNCELVAGITLNEQPELRLGLRVKNHVSKNRTGDGTLVVEMIGGVPPYLFTCEGSNGFTFTASGIKNNSYEINNLEGGIYTITLFDSASCAYIRQKIMLQEPGKLLAYISDVKNITCNGAKNGYLRASIIGGDENYDILWEGPDIAEIGKKELSGLEPGTYKITVSSGGKSISDEVEITEPAALQANVTNSKDILCLGSLSGEVELQITGGTPEYAVLWEGSNGFLSQSDKIMELNSGNYSFTITDANGCKVQGEHQIKHPDEIQLNLIPGNISEEGLQDGSLQINLTGGIAPYTYYLTGPFNYTQVADSYTGETTIWTNLKRGIYRVEAEDSNGCTVVKKAEIREPGKMVACIQNKQNVICNGENNGWIHLKTEGGSGDYSYNWTGPDYFVSNNQNIQNLKAGTYYVEITDNLTLEQTTLQTEITQPAAILAEYWVDNVSCTGLQDGYINIHPQGGTPGYSFLWSDNTPARFQEDRANLSAGTYEVIISDTNNCVSGTISIQIQEPLPLTVSENFTEPTCYSFTDGKIQLEPRNGTPPYRLHWEETGSILTELSALGEGNYHYNLTDKNNCKTTGVINLSQPDTLIAEILDFDHITCFDGSKGRALVSVTGGMAGYRFNWSDGQTTPEAVNLDQGNYKIKVTDANGCTGFDSITIQKPGLLKIHVEKEQPTTINSGDGSIHLHASGGTPPYTFQWDTLNRISSLLTGLNAGSYKAAITDFNGCVLDTLITLKNKYDDRISIQKAFTPNYDGYNDIWEIDRIQFVDKLKIAVYTRWGKIIYKFEGNGNQYRNRPWDGREGNRDLPPGSYYYAIQLDNDKPIVGIITIIR